MKALIITAAIAIVIGISFQYASAAEYRYSDNVDQLLQENGVNFIRNIPKDSYAILPGGDERTLVAGYDSTAEFCESTKHIRKVKLVTIYGSTGVTSASCE